MSPRHQLALAALSLGEPIPVDIMAELEATGLILDEDAPNDPDLCDDEGCDHYGTPHVCIFRPLTADL